MVDEVLEKYPNDVKVVFKSFPLSSHKQAFKAAKYVMAAGRQGKFKEMYHKYLLMIHGRNFEIMKIYLFS